MNPKIGLRYKLVEKLWKYWLRIGPRFSRCHVYALADLTAENTFSKRGGRYFIYIYTHTHIYIYTYPHKYLFTERNVDRFENMVSLIGMEFQWVPRQGYWIPSALQTAFRVTVVGQVRKPAFKRDRFYWLFRSLFLFLFLLLSLRFNNKPRCRIKR